MSCNIQCTGCHRELARNFFKVERKGWKNVGYYAWCDTCFHSENFRDIHQENLRNRFAKTITVGEYIIYEIHVT